MTKNVWRCRCGKRAEVLTGENFGDCGCSDPVYGPEYFYMSEECADMLDEMDKDYDEQHKHLAEALETSAIRSRIVNKQTLKIAEARAEIERLRQELRDNSTLAARQIVPAEMLVDDLAAEIERKDKLIEKMREALKTADILIDDLVDTHVEKCASVYDDDRNEIKAALSAAGRK
jgi:DNA repair exonuclease SbcCD ATPase subunit